MHFIFDSIEFTSRLLKLSLNVRLLRAVANEDLLFVRHREQLVRDFLNLVVRLAQMLFVLRSVGVKAFEFVDALRLCLELIHQLLSDVQPRLNHSAFLLILHRAIKFSTNGREFGLRGVHFLLQQTDFRWIHGFRLQCGKLLLDGVALRLFFIQLLL